MQESKMKYCRHCGAQIPDAAVLCTACGCLVEPIQNPNIIINNTNTNTNTVGYGRVPKNKWVAVLLCMFLGWAGAHKFYENKPGLGVLYLLTCGLLTIGWLIDLLVLLFKPNPYYV